MIRGGIVGGLYGKGGGGGGPVSYYYGKSQTKRVGENYTPAGSGNRRLAEFKATADEVYDGGKSDLLTILNGGDVANLDVTGQADKTVLQFSNGRYDLLFEGYSASASQGGFRVELREVKMNADDTVITHTSGFTSGTAPANTTYQLIYPDFVVAGTEQFYFLFPIHGDRNRSHFLRVEKVG
ncbi:hypothetical protein C6499_22635 [Candidatus Poribacteria bacterium]|nr:MAG: hypothetical protein C6499_22635 [Candidatus Poribacteria bacterium]